MRSKAAMHRPVVDQLERHAVFQPLRAGARLRFRKLLGRQRDAGDAGAVVAREREREAAPAAADVEHRQARPVEQQFRGDVPLLRHLGLVDRLVAAREVGARVLPVAVEEQAVEPAVEVVVVRDVAPRPPGGVELRQPPRHQPDRLAQLHHRVAAGLRRQVGDQHVQHLEDAAADRDEPALHVALADGQRRVQRQPPQRARVLDLDHRLRPGLAGVEADRAVRPAHGQAAQHDETLQNQVQQRTHDRLRRPPSLTRL